MMATEVSLHEWARDASGLQMSSLATNKNGFHTLEQ